MEFNGMKLPDNAYDLLVERGLIASVTNPEIVRELMEKKKSHSTSVLTQLQTAFMLATSCSCWL